MVTVHTSPWKLTVVKKGLNIVFHYVRKWKNHFPTPDEFFHLGEYIHFWFSEAVWLMDYRKIIYFLKPRTMLSDIYAWNTKRYSARNVRLDIFFRCVFDWSRISVSSSALKVSTKELVIKICWYQFKHCDIASFNILIFSITGSITYSHFRRLCIRIVFINSRSIDHSF